MTAAATTTDLYLDRDNPNSKLGEPPAPPTPVPPPTQPVRVTEPVVTKARMADEGPDGKVRDTSTEALRPGNDLGFRNLDDEQTAAKAAEAKPAETKPAEVTPPPEPPKEPKLYAGRFKTPEELEKGYEEARKKMQEALAERDVLQRQQTVQAVTPPPAPPAKTPEQLAQEQTEANQILNDFVQNPKGFIDKHTQEAIQRTQVALAAQEVTNQWRKANPDLAEHEFYVAAEASRLIQSDPELAKNPAALFDKATANFRQLTGKLRTEGAKEALTQETRVVPLVSSSTGPEAGGQPPQKTPLTADEAYGLHLRMLKEQEQRSHRGLRR